MSSNRWRILAVGLGLMLTLAGCALPSPPLVQQAATPTPMTGATPAPTAALTPPLASIYLYTSTNDVVLLNLADKAVTVAETDSTHSILTGTHCLATYNQVGVYYRRVGELLYVDSLYIGHRPFTIHPDGTLTQDVTNPATGQIVTQTYRPSSTQAYSTAVDQLAVGVPHC